MEWSNRRLDSTPHAFHGSQVFEGVGVPVSQRPVRTDVISSSERSFTPINNAPATHPAEERRRVNSERVSAALQHSNENPFAHYDRPPREHVAGPEKHRTGVGRYSTRTRPEPSGPRCKGNEMSSDIFFFAPPADPYDEPIPIHRQGRLMRVDAVSGGTVINLVPPQPTRVEAPMSFERQMASSMMLGMENIGCRENDGCEDFDNPRRTSSHAFPREASWDHPTMPSRPRVPARSPASQQRWLQSTSTSRQRSRPKHEKSPAAAYGRPWP